ncbi:MAG: nicotinamidase [Magnetococcales bacterium]|nr:nicotinamidase [Magnetococcales bacterium]
MNLPPRQRTASFDVDAQNTFTPVCPEELPVPGGTEIVAELNAQAAYASLRVGSKDAHSPKAIWVADEEHPQFSPVAGENVDIRWNRHAEPGTVGFQLIDGLPPITDYDHFVWKGVEPEMHPYGACYHDFAEKMSTGVIEFLTSRTITTVVVGGLATDYCVKTTVLQLRRAGFDVVVNLGACRGIAPETVDTAIDEMRQAGVRFVDTAAELINETD